MSKRNAGADGNIRIDIAMTVSRNILDEVVVTGITSTDKRLFTGATSKIDAEKMNIAGVAEVGRSLEGKVSGVSVQNVSGTFGVAPKIRVRGGHFNFRLQQTPLGSRWQE